MKHKRLKQQKQISGKYEWVIYMDENKLWHWYKRRANSSGTVLGESHKGFSSKKSCIDNATLPGLVNSHNDWEDMPDWIEQ